MLTFLNNEVVETAIALIVWASWITVRRGL